MKKKVLWVTLIVIIAGLTSCYGGKEKTIDSPTENLSGVNEDTLPENIANEIEEDEKISQDLVAENIASAEEKSTEEESPIEVYHDPDLDVKYSEDGKVVLRYQDQELDITDKFGLVSDSGDD